MSTPPISIVPALGLSMPAIRFSSVLLPEPLGPISATNSPAMHVEVDVQQHGDVLLAALVGLGQAADADQRRARSPACAHLPAHLPATRDAARRRPACRPGSAPAGRRPSARRRSISSTSPSVRPGVTGTASSVSPRRCAAPTGRPSRCDHGARVDRQSPAGSRPRSGRCVRNTTLALISGSMRGSSCSKRILVITVALARSTVGTMRTTLPRKRASGRASSVISTGMSMATGRRCSRRRRPRPPACPCRPS